MAEKVIDKKEDAAVREPSFWDSIWGMGFLVAAILLARWYILEPFKIPSGSMEPTLFGHEDYGDRIVTNKLAYGAAKQVLLVMGCSAALIIAGFIASKGWKRVKSIVLTALLMLGVVGGIGLAWSQGAVAGEPQRFDVVVFHYNAAWVGDKPQDINYIKRLIGLPGEIITISGGDLFLRKGEKDEVIRKPNYRASLQETLWYPVSKAFSPQVHESPKDDNPSHHEIAEAIEHIRFPWDGVDDSTPGAKLSPKSLQLDGSAPLTLDYKFDVSNIYLKQGRWPFRHIDCPATKLPPDERANGIKFRNPNNKTEQMSAFVTNTWEGVQCPQCKEILFPIRPPTARKQIDPLIIPGDAKFYYGGDQTVGDLKLELGIEVETGGTIHLEVGSDLHAASWTIGAAAESGDDSKVHPVKTATPSLAPGHHTLSLAYIDGTVIAILDGQQIEKREIDIKPPGEAADKIQSVARVKFSGLKGTLTKLELWRDLYYTSKSSSDIRRGKPALRYLDGNFIADIEKDNFLMLGDNSPGSSDGRVWGTVPRERLIGRASFVWWPPSRWRLIK